MPRDDDAPYGSRKRQKKSSTKGKAKANPGKGKAGQAPAWQPPVPPDAAPINTTNRLHLLPQGIRRDDARPWFAYDWVDPAPKFRHMGAQGGKKRKEKDYVPEGEDMEMLTDNPEDDTKPVEVQGYV